MSNTLKEISNEKCEMEMTPMIDVTFLLLIFFVCTIKFKTLEGKLAAYLPKDVGVNSSDAEPKEKIDIVLKVKNAGEPVEFDAMEKGRKVPWTSPKQGEFTLLGHEVEYNVNRDTFKDDEAGIAAMSARLKQMLIVDPERAVTIKAMQGVVYKDIIPVLDTCIDVGFTDVTFAGSYQ
jgi:biopolymer transport protein ExbD